MDWLTYDEAAGVARVTRQTIYDWWRRGILKTVTRTPSGRPRFLRVEVELRRVTKCDAPPPYDGSSARG